MGNRSQLFQIQDCVIQYNHEKKKQKAKTDTKETKKEKGMAGAVSLSFYDDGAPITLSGSVWNHSFSQSASEPLDQAVTEDAAFSIMEHDGEDEYSINKELEMLSVSNDQYDTIRSLTETSEEQVPHGSPARTALEDSPGTLSEAEMAADLSSIFSVTPEEKKKEAKPQEDDFFKKMMEKNQEQKETNATPEETETQQPSGGNHKIFDAIAKSLNYANAFDLGDYVLEQRFDLFDQEEDKRIAGESNREKSELAIRGTESVRNWNEPKIAELSTRTFLEDLDSIQESSEAFGVKVDKTTRDWPPPGNLIQPTVEITKQLFGTFEYENIPNGTNCEVRIKGNWENDNIENVDIPQIKGVANGSRGYIRFNKKAKKQLQRLWKAWEDAKLLDRIITYDGGFVPRYKKLKGGGCATSLSNHAWGSAFDINAAWNGLGVEPALVGQKGCTRELVEIAAQHGFYWGGHFSNKDGMHFEVAKIIEYPD